MRPESDKATDIMAIEPFAKGTRPRCHLLDVSDARIIVSGDEAVRIRLSHKQNAQIESERCLGVIARRLATHLCSCGQIVNGAGPALATRSGQVLPS